MVSYQVPEELEFWSHLLLGYIVGSPFHCMQEKGSAACGVLIKRKSNLKNRFLGLQMVQFECLIHTMMSFTSGVHYGVPFSLHAGKGNVAFQVTQEGQLDLN